MRPTQGMLAAAEDSPAKAAVAAEVQAVGAFDKVPFSSGSCIFTMDTATDIFIMHSIQVSLSAGVWPMLVPWRDHCSARMLSKLNAKLLSCLFTTAANKQPDVQCCQAQAALAMVLVSNAGTAGWWWLPAGGWAHVGGSDCRG